MSNKKKINIPAFLIGSLVGGVLGASVGLSFAPKPGRVLRKDINTRSKEALEKAEDWKETVQEKSAVYSEKVKAKGTELKNKKSITKSDHNKMNIPSFVMGSCVGGILGASIGLSFAPKPGSELREDINMRSKEVIEKAEDWKETLQENDSGFSDKAKTIGTELKNKSADIKNKAIEKAGEWKEAVTDDDTYLADRVMNKVSKLIDQSVALKNNIIQSINKFVRIAEQITEFSMDTTDKTKDLYKDVSNKAKSLKQEVVETSTEIKDEVVDHTQEVAMDAKELNVDE